MPPIGRWRPDNPTAFVRAYVAGATTRELAREHGVSKDAVRCALTDLGVELRPPTPRRWRPANLDQMVRRYGDGVSVRQLSQEYGVSWNTVAHALLSAGVEMRGPQNPPVHITRWSPPDPDRLKADYLAGTSANRLAKQHGVAPLTVIRVLRSMGIEIRSRAATRGGRPRSVAGPISEPSPAFVKTIDRFIADMRLYGRMSEKTETSYRARLLRLASVSRHTDPVEVDRDDIKLALSLWPNSNTRRTAHATLASFFDYLMEEGLRSENPARQVRRTKKQETDVYRLTLSESVAMMRAADAGASRDRRVVYIALCTGLRNQELRALQGRDFTSRPGFVRVTPEAGKGKAGRWVPVIRDLCPVVEEIARSVADEEYVIPARRSGDPGRNSAWRDLPELPASPQSINRTVKTVAKRAGIQASIHPHLLRHAFGDHVARHAGLHRAQEVLGHASVSTTQEYYVGRPTLDELATALRDLKYDDDSPDA